MKLASDYRNTPNVQKGIPRDQKIEVKVRKGTGHIFTHSRARKCLCKKTRRYNYPRNHHTLTKKVNELLEDPDNGFLGEIATHGLTALKKQVKK